MSKSWEIFLWLFKCVSGIN